MQANDDTHTKKAHRPSRSSIKLNKKQQKNNKNGQPTHRHNPKAFTFSGGVRSVQKNVQRTLDIKAKRLRVENIDKTPEVPPPIIVVVQGPPKCGKSTLIRSLVKHYTKQTINEIKGPITVVTGKNRRLTFIEATHDVSTLLDLAKIADLVLMMIDASFGFDMETFEFLSVLKTHGFPRILGVLSHIDKFDDNKMLKKRKKRFKKRFWTEIYEGAKLFYLSGIQYRRYRKRDILNLARYLAVQRFEVLSWRSTHPYFLSLRTEEISQINEEDTHNSSSTNESISAYFYGYLKGARMRVGQDIHIPGAGDFIIDKIDDFTDPCPAPISGIREKHPNKPLGPTTGSQAMRTLKDSHRAIYAPYCNVETIQYDSDAIYIHLPDSTDTFTRPEFLIDNEKKDKIKPNKEEENSEDDETAESESEKDLEEDEDEVEDEVEDDEDEEEEKDDDEEEEDNHNNKKENNGVDNNTDNAIAMVRSLQDAEGHLDKKIASHNLRLLPNSKSVLQETPIDNEDTQSISSTSSDESMVNIIDTPTEFIDYSWLPEDYKNIKEFVYTKPSDNAIQITKEPIKQAHNSSKLDLFEDEPEFDYDSLEFYKRPSAKNFGQIPPGNLLFDDFDSAVIPAWTFLRHFGLPVNSLKDLIDLSKNEELKAEIKRDHFGTGGWDEDEPTPQEENEDETKEEQDDITGQGAVADTFDKVAISKAEKERKDAMIKMQMEVQEFSNPEMGVSIGTYIRILVKGLPKDWFRLIHQVKKPILVGGLLPGESSFGFSKLRFQKHRWAPKILKTNDPLIFSIGWRRFQSMPIYYMDDRNNTRQKMLKYTPLHMHCQAMVYGPVVPPTTGVLALKSYDTIEGFRIAGLGVTLETEASVNIMKKLKLVGEPKKILKNTAFIKGMFGSELEVSKFIGAKIMTVSGIRGQIKKAFGQKGIFRATFEDKILLSDLVVCKSWIKVNPHKFYNGILDVPNWRRMKLVSELRNEMGIPTPYKAESEYKKKPERATRRFNPLKIPKAIAGNLPFSSKPKVELPKKRKNDDLSIETRVELSPYEKKIASMFHKMETLKNERQRIREEKQKLRSAKFEKESKKKEEIALNKRKTIKKTHYIKKGKQEASARRKLRVEDGK